MKKRVIVLITLLVLVLTTMSAQAVEPRAISNKPNLSFSSTTAHCSAVCTGAGSSDKVEATLTLYQGTTYVDSWSDSGKGSVSISGECTVKSGKSYRLTLTYSINGVSKPSASTTATCP